MNVDRMRPVSHRLPLLVALVVAFIASASVSAAGKLENKNVRIVYVEHNTSTDVPTLTRTLSEFRDDTFYDAAVFYFSNGEESLKLQFNVDSVTDNKREDFKKLTDILNLGSYHNVDARIDLDNLVEIFNGLDLIGPDNSLKAKNLEILFYVSGNYFELGLAKEVIAKLFSILDISRIQPQGKVQFQVLYSPNDPKMDFLTVPEPFGPENLDGINDYMRENQFLVTY